MVEAISSLVLKNSKKDNLLKDSERLEFAEARHSLAPKNLKAQALADKSNLVVRQLQSLSAQRRLMESANDTFGLSSKDPVISPNYFLSPIRTLKESIPDHEHDCITVHDLTEAYNALSNKIRSQIHIISSVTEPPPSLAIFKTNAFDIMDCLTRDIRRVLPNPFESQHHSLSVAEFSFGSAEPPNEDDFRIMIDEVTLCQFAIRFASDILSFPALYSNFTDVHLTTLLRDILSFCTTPVPGILNLPKLRAMATWTLKVQQLPLSVLTSLRPEIVSALRSSISRQSRGDAEKLDAFKAIHCILNSHPDLIEPFLELLPLTLQHLTCNSPQVQLHAALALSGFAIVKFHSLSGGQFPLNQTSELIKTFIDDQASLPRSSQTDDRLSSIFNDALVDGPEWRKHGPSFALTVVSCFLILLDHQFFAHPRSVKIVLTVLQQCAGHKRNSVYRLQSQLWKLLFWAFHRIPLPHEKAVSDSQPGIRERAFRLVCEDLRGDRRSSLIAVLLGGCGSNSTVRSQLDIRRAVSVADGLFKAGDSSQTIALLARMMSSIGAPTISTSGFEDGVQVYFSRTLVDGTLLSQPTRELRVSPLTISFDRLQPFSEQEVLRNWDALSALWVSIVRSELSHGRVLSPAIVQVWQALLLVHGVPIPGEKTLSAPSALLREAASILTNFQMELDTAERQSLYLSSIWKLWSVVKNVFIPASLSHPAEKLLASLLRTKFLLTNGEVKQLWSQLCGDLISVGVPTLLHVLRVRSEKQEEVEVTRQLWLLLARNGPLTGGQENWEDLLQFLIMPFSVWDMSSQEFDMWKDIFKRALELGAQASKAVGHVVSEFLGLFKEVRLASLKTCSRTLHWLLSQLISSHGPWVDTSLLVVIDDFIFSSYASSVEAKVYALDMLRLIAGFIPNISPTEIVKFLSTLQRGMARWIADEKKLLDDHEDEELIHIVYKPSLQLLAKVEPSIEVLESVAAFVHSVFIRVRGDGPLAFHNFWRSTYHKREDISKDDYPLPIQLCLKAWSDFTADSVADDISLDSGSQSLRSYVIPDSQPLEELDFSEAVFTFDASRIPSDGPLHIMTHDYSADLQSNTSTTGPSKKAEAVDMGNQDAATGLPMHRLSRHEIQDSGGVDQAESDPATFPQLFASIAKRYAEYELPRTPKRPRTHKYSSIYQDRRGNSKRPSAFEDVLPPADTPNSARQKREPRSHTPPWVGGDISKFQIPHLTPQADPVPSSDDIDYDSWEQGISVEDLRQMQNDLQGRSDFVPDSEENLNYDLNTEPVTEPDESDDRDILSPSLGDYPLRSKQRHRSQTAPELSPTSHSISVAQPLRRNQTTPLERQKSSAQLEALQQAYAIVADTGTSQIDVQDIMQARRLANQINQILDEQILSKVAGAKPPSDG